MSVLEKMSSILEQEREEKRMKAEQLERMKARATTTIYAAEYDEMVLITKILLHRKNISNFFSNLHILGRNL